MCRVVWKLAAASVLAIQLVLATTVMAQSGVKSNDSFVVRNIRLEGLQRISEGAVYNYLPVDIGDDLNERRIQEALRATYASGFFTDVEMRREENTLIVVLRERPSIAEFEITGNKDLKTEDLTENLRTAGLATGLSFNHSLLDEVEQFLVQEYFSRGKYAATVKTKVEDLEDNRVKVSVIISEGDRAQIKQINIVGNKVFSDSELRKEMELRTPNFLSWFKKDDRYSKEALSGDLEKLTSYYMDRGYAQFDVTSTQVAISPNKKDVFININIDEGDTYTVSEVKLSGDMVIPEEQLRPLVLLKPGQMFSRKLMERTNEFIQFRLGQEGFARAEVQPIPTIDDEARTMALNLRVVSGERVYVRNINFNGAQSINDETLRREMRQMEGGWLSNTAIERSEQRIRSKPYVEDVSFETVPVPGSSDLVDVEFEIEEGLPGQWGGGVGYSGRQGVILNGNFTHTNFLGKGNRVGLDINAGRYSKVYSISHTEPYATPDGISRRFSVAFRDTTQFISGSSDFSTETLVGSLEYGIPISEYSSLSLGASYQDTQLIASGFTGSTQALSFVNNNGNPFELINQNMGPCGSLEDFASDFSVPADICGTKFDVFEMFAGYNYNSLDRFIFPTKGLRQKLSFSMTAPGSKVEYYVGAYDLVALRPLWGDFILSLNLEFAFGDALNDTTDLPPVKNFYAGGPDSVRGFRQAQLGPIDSRGNPFGGNMKTLGQLELIVPMPEKFQDSARASLFYDIGNVWYTGSTPYLDVPGTSLIDYDFDASELRQSAGVSIQWLAPLGTFQFSYAFPLHSFDGTKDSSGNTIRFADEVERFQFTIGRSF